MTPEERAEKLAWFRSGLTALEREINPFTAASVEVFPTFIEVRVDLAWPEGQQPMGFGSYRFPREAMEHAEACRAWMVEELELNPLTSEWISNYLSDLEALL